MKEYPYRIPSDRNPRILKAIKDFDKEVNIRILKKQLETAQEQIKRLEKFLAEEELYSEFLEKALGVSKSPQEEQ